MAIDVPGSRHSDLRPVSDRSATSAAQRRAWLLHHTSGEQATQNLAVTWRLRGPFDFRALDLSLADLTGRHGILRTRYHFTDGHLQQAISADHVRAHLFDLTDRPFEAAMATAREAAARDAAQRFDLAEDAPMRLRVYRLRQEDHVLSACFHHIAVDGWSLEIFWRELSHSYHTAVRGDTSRAASPQLEYADYAVWHNTWLQSTESARHHEYWCRTLRDAPRTRLEPRSRPALAGDGGAELLHASLPTEVSDRLRDLGRDNGTTGFVVMMAGFCLLLSDCIGSTDLVLGMPATGRMRPELEDMVGVFLNALPVRVRWSGDPTPTELVGLVRRTVLEAQEHQEIPFDQIVRSVGAPRRRDRNPLFDVWFDVAPDGAHPTFPGVRIEPMLPPAQQLHTLVDLEVRVAGDAPMMSVSFFYRPTRYAEATVRALATRYIDVLTSMAQRPHAVVSRVELGDVPPAVNCT